MDDCYFNPRGKNYKSHFKPNQDIKRNLLKYKLVKPENKYDEKRKTHTSFITSDVESMKSKWFLDSCASQHIINDNTSMYNYVPLKEKIGVKSSHEETNLEVIGI